MTTATTYSPGLEGVIAGETAICTVEGGLIYRGYFVGDLAEHCSFDEVAHPLLHGELPTAKQLEGFQSRVAAARRLPPPLKDLLAALPKWTTPLDALRTSVSALGHFDQDAADNTHDANLRGRAADGADRSRSRTTTGSRRASTHPARRIWARPRTSPTRFAAPIRSPKR